MGNIAEELTKAQEDYIETTGSDAYYDKKCDAEDRGDSYYDDWFSDNKTDLLNEFVEDVMPSEFKEYCRVAFQEHKDDLK